MRALVLGSVVLVCGWLAGTASFARAQNAGPTGTPAIRHKVTAEQATALRVVSVPPKYPEEAVKAGIQGAVTLTVVIDVTGGVKEVTVDSGDPALAPAAVEAARQWKYKPFEVDGTAVEFETSVTVNFRLKTLAPQPAPLGEFRNGEYVNEYFRLYYPLSRERFFSLTGSAGGRSLLTGNRGV